MSGTHDGGDFIMFERVQTHGTRSQRRALLCAYENTPWRTRSSVKQVSIGRAVIMKMIDNVLGISTDATEGGRNDR